MEHSPSPIEQYPLVVHFFGDVTHRVATSYCLPMTDKPYFVGARVYRKVREKVADAYPEDRRAMHHTRSRIAAASYRNAMAVLGELHVASSNFEELDQIGHRGPHAVAAKERVEALSCALIAHALAMVASVNSRNPGPETEAEGADE